MYLGITLLEISLYERIDPLGIVPFEEMETIDLCFFQGVYQNKIVKEAIVGLDWSIIEEVMSVESPSG